MIDREKVIKGLEILTNRNGCEYIHCDDCCFYISTKPTRCGLREEQIKEDALALLKEQEAVVRCKDCVFWQDNNDGYPHHDCKWREDETPDPDDYCSAGERKKGR